MNTYTELDFTYTPVIPAFTVVVTERTTPHGTRYDVPYFTVDADGEHEYTQTFGDKEPRTIAGFVADRLSHTIAVTVRY